MAYSQEFENKIIEEIQRLNGKIDNFNCVLTEKIEEVNTNLEKVNTNLSNRIEEVNTNLEEVNANLSNRIEEVNTNLSERIEEVNANLSNRIEEVNTNLSKKIEDVNIDLHTMKNTNIAQILNQETKVQEDIGKIKKEIESINNKLDHHIKQSIVDHKRFDYEIAKLQMQS